MGYPLIPDTSDPNAPADGLATFDVTINDKNQRVSTFNAFIPREVALLREKHLSICTRAIVSRIVWSNKPGDLCATSVQFTTPDPKSGKVFSAKVRKEVVICSGSIGTPQVLMLRYVSSSHLPTAFHDLTDIQSGIGPRKHLEDLGIEVKKDLSGVGSELVSQNSTLIRHLLTSQCADRSSCDPHSMGGPDE